MLFKLFWEFLKIGLFSVGGGMATLPFLYDLSDRTGWFTYQQIADMVAVSESTPGPIGINMATYVGYTVDGVAGAMIATFGEITPGIFIVSMIAVFLHRFHNNRYVDAAFYGLRPCSTGLIASAGISVLLLSLFNVKLFQATGNILDLLQWKGMILAVTVYTLTNQIEATKRLHPIVFLSASAIVGVVLSLGGA